MVLVPEVMKTSDWALAWSVSSSLCGRLQQLFQVPPLLLCLVVLFSLTYYQQSVALPVALRFASRCRSKCHNTVPDSIEFENILISNRKANQPWQTSLTKYKTSRLRESNPDIWNNATTQNKCVHHCCIKSGVRHIKAKTTTTQLLSWSTSLIVRLISLCWLIWRV